MRHEDNSRKLMLLYIVGLAVAAVLVCCMCGCTTTRYVPVESVREVSRTDTVYEAVWRSDSVVERDSVLTFVKGDTVTVEKVRWRIRVKERKDTVHETRIDSVMVREPYPVEVVKEVAKPLAWWQRSLMWLGGGGLLAAVVALAIFVTGKTRLFR